MADTTGATYLSNISYHPNGMWDQITHGNTLLDRQDIQHGMMRPAKLETLDTLGTHRFSTDQIAYDGAGNIKSMGTTRFAYDPVSRLTGARQDFSEDSWRDTNFSYDPYGNLTGRSGLDQTGSFSESFPVDLATNHLSGEIYNDHGAQKTQFGTGSGSVSVEWDDFFEEVSKVRQGGDERSFAYDADGERVIAGDGIDDTRFFLRDLDGKVLSEFELISNQPVWKKDYIYRGSQMVAVEDADEGLMHFHLDHLGTPRLITDAWGNTVATHDYAPFGFEVSNPLADSVTKKFTGHERDGGDNPGTKYDLDYMHARYYSAWQSRFLSVDPAPGDPKNPQSWNRYAYVLGNPVKYVDPFGLAECTKTGVGEYTCTESAPEEPQWYRDLMMQQGIERDFREHDAWAGQHLDANGVEVMRLVGRAAPLARGFEFLATVYTGFFEGGAAVEDLLSGVARISGMRNVLLRCSQSEKVQSLVRYVYRSGARFGNGSTMDAVRFETASGQLLSPAGHFQKTSEIIIRAKRLLTDSTLGAEDRAVLEYIIRDAEKALGGN